MGQPKRVWSNKKTVWDGKKSVWLQDGELKTYDGNREDAGSDLQTYGSQWEEVSDNAILDVYDSNTPEPIGTPEDGIKATYTFKDYDGTVLKTGTVDDGGTPVAPTDPTREATAQYTYTFAGWSPAVGPIAKNTVYTATYTSTVNTYTVTIATNDATYGTVSPTSVTAPYGTSISTSDNVLTIGETTVTATAESGYAFSSWGTLPATVTGTTTITATFEQELYIEINEELSDTTGTVGGQVTVYFSTVGTPGVLYSDDPDILTVVDTDATGGEGWTNKVTYSVGGTGTTTATITVTKNGQTASDSIQITCSAAATPENAVVLDISKNEDDEYSWYSANIFQIGPGDTSERTQPNKNPKGPDYIYMDESSPTITAAGAWADNARITALIGDSDMMGYIHTAIDGVISEATDMGIQRNNIGYIFFNAPYWTALNTYLTDSTTDLATLKSTFATLIGDSTPMFSGYTSQLSGSYEPINVTASYDATNDATTVKIFVDDLGNYTEFRHIWNGQGGYDIQLSKYDTNVGIVMKKIFDCSWDAVNESTKETYKNTLEEALRGIADEINSIRGTDTTWSGVFFDADYALTAFLRSIFRSMNVDTVNSFFEEINTIHDNSGTVFSTQS